ncbi:MAG: hypothetical protein ACLUOI_28215 [Eisenbergiella sp.]
MKKSPAVHLLLYSLAHFLVDFLCAYMIFRKTRESTLFYTGLLLYNFCAFAVQMPLGILADRAKRCGLAAVWGGGSAACPGASYEYRFADADRRVWQRAVSHRRRNCRTRENPGRHAEPGIFVSTGALGLGWGRWPENQPAFLPG